MTTTLLQEITIHITEQLAVEQETIPHSRTTMALAIRYRQDLVADNITQIAVAIKFMYLNAAVLMNGKIDTFVAIRE